MQINQQFNGIIIGGVFTLASLMLALTFIVPVVSVLPGMFLEVIMAEIVDNDPYSNVGKATLGALLFILILSFVLIFVQSQKVVFKNRTIIGIMFFEYFIIHAIGFYIYWATSLDFRSDGQLIFGAVKSYPFSSFGFLGLGILIDLIKSKTLGVKDDLNTID